MQTLRQPLLGFWITVAPRTREKKNIPKIVATFVSACSQGQRTHSGRTNTNTIVLIHPASDKCIGSANYFSNPIICKFFKLTIISGAQFENCRRIQEHLRNLWSVLSLKIINLLGLSHTHQVVFKVSIRVGQSKVHALEDITKLFRITKG